MTEKAAEQNIQLVMGKQSDDVDLNTPDYLVGCASGFQDVKFGVCPALSSCLYCPICVYMNSTTSSVQVSDLQTDESCIHINIVSHL